MIQTPMDVLKNFPIRKSKKQKTTFREAAQKYFEYQGYEYREEKGSLGARNVVIGDPIYPRALCSKKFPSTADIQKISDILAAEMNRCNLKQEEAV
jgi:hypothetical protein